MPVFPSNMTCQFLEVNPAAHEVFLTYSGDVKYLAYSELLNLNLFALQRYD